MEEEKEFPAVNEESDSVDDELLADAPTSKKMIVMQVFLGIVIFFLIAGLALLSYRLLPNNQKVSGSWQAIDNPLYELQLSDNQARLSVKELNGVKGVRLEIKSTISPVDSTYYSGKNTSAFLVIDKEKQDKEVLDAIKKQTNYYKQVKETKKQLTFKYTSEAKIVAFGVEHLDTSFHFVVREWKYGIIPQEVHFQNEAFAVNGLTFTRQK